MGHPVELCSDVAEVIAIAAQLWERYPVLSDSEPVRLRVMVGPAGDHVSPDPMPPRGQGNLLSIVHSANDYAIADLSGGFGFAILSPATLATPNYFRYYFLEPLIYVMQAARHFLFVHGACIARDGRALVLCGNSGAGKTCLAYYCARQGWDFVSGDAVHVVRNCRDRTVIGRPYEIRFRKSAQQLFPELLPFPAERRPNGKTDLEVDTRLLEMPLCLSSPAKHIVFIERSNRTELEKIPNSEAILNLEETICFGDARIRSEQHNTLSHFAGLPSWRLRYDDLHEAERCLASLIDAHGPC